MVYVEPSPILRHLILQIDLDAVSDVHVERQRTWFDTARRHLHFFAFKHIHFPVVIAEDHLAFKIDLDHTRVPLL